MKSSVHWELIRPTEPKIFEALIRDLFAAHWGDPNTQIYGRSGQKQNGVDIYGKPHEGKLVFGIQCKLREEKPLTETNLKEEIDRTKDFHLPLDTYIFATTLPRDTKLSRIIDKLNQEKIQERNLKIQIRFWEDICSLLDEHPNIKKKYFETKPQNYYIYEPLENHPDTITSSSPLLIGILFDVSNSMYRLANEISHDLSKQSYEALNKLVEKALAYCKTPEADEVLPRFALFTYGYGLGKGRKRFADLLWRVGFQAPSLNPTLIPSDPVRDLFAEVASKESLPFTPNASDLHIYWNHYKKSIENQFFDIGEGHSILYEGLNVVHKRFRKELERPYYKHPILIIVSDGQSYGANETDLIRITHEIQELGVQIFCAYIGRKNIMKPREFFVKEQNNWPIEARRLFQCSSIISPENKLREIAKDEGWIVPNSAKLFIQANQPEMLEELITFLLNPLKNK